MMMNPIIVNRKRPSRGLVFVVTPTYILVFAGW